MAGTEQVDGVGRVLVMNASFHQWRRETSEPLLPVWLTEFQWQVTEWCSRLSRGEFISVDIVIYEVMKFLNLHRLGDKVPLSDIAS